MRQAKLGVSFCLTRSQYIKVLEKMLIVKDIEPVLSKEAAHDDRLFEMANLRQKTTGLPVVIWVSEKGHTKHGLRVKVSISHSHKADINKTVSISITDEP